MENTPKARRTRISPAREAELFAATIDVLRDSGFGAMTMDAVAARARTSKATLYRQWGGKVELVSAAVSKYVLVDLNGIDTGSLHGDVRAAFDRVAADADRITEVLMALGHALASSVGLHAALVQSAALTQKSAIDAIVARAVERGEIVADSEIAGFLPELLVCPLVGHVLASGTPLDGPGMTRFVDAVVFPALSAAAPL